MREKGLTVSFLTLPLDKKLRVDSAVRTVRTAESFTAGIGKYTEIAKWYIFQFDPISYFFSKNYLSRIMPDVVHFGNFQFLTFGALLAAHQLKIPAVVSIYDYWYFCPMTTLLDYDGITCRRFHGKWCIHCLPDKFHFIQKFFLSLRKKVFDFFLEKADKFIVLSRSSRQILIEYGIKEDRISVIRLPYPDIPGQAQPGAEDKENSILFVGWLQRRKGLHILLEAMPIVWQKMPGVKLYIVAQKVKWEPEYEHLILSRLRNMPQDRFVFLLGQRKQEELRNLMRSSAVVVVPEQWENMSPLIVIEAMALSRPVVASDIGGIREFIADGKDGLLAAYQDPADFAEKITALLNNKEMREAIAGNANAKIRGMLNKEIIANQYIQEYEKSRVG